MRRIMILSSFALSMFMIIGCSGNTENNTSNNSTENKTDNHEPTFLESQIPQCIVFNNEEYKMLTGIGSSNRVKENLIGDLIGYLINSDDVDNFIIDFPNALYVVSDDVYDVTTNNRVAFFKVIGVDDMSYICCQQLLFRKSFR